MFADEIIFSGESDNPLWKIYYGEFGKSIKSSQRFSLDDNFVKAAVNVSNTKPASILKGLHLCRIPYESTWFEFTAFHREWIANPTKPIPRKIGALCEAHPEYSGCTLIHLCWQHQNGQIDLCPLALLLDFSAEGVFLQGAEYEAQKKLLTKELALSKLKQSMEASGISTSNLDDEANAALEISKKVLLYPNKYFGPIASHLQKAQGDSILKELFDTSQEDAWEELRFMVATLLLLNSRNCVSNEKIEQEAANPSRIKKGKMPLFDYKVLKLKLSKIQATARKTANLSSAEIRAHLVRGHFKVRKSGVYWWAPFLRGNLKAGFLNKDYEVLDSPENEVSGR